MAPGLQGVIALYNHSVAHWTEPWGCCTSFIFPSGCCVLPSWDWRELWVWRTSPGGGLVNPCPESLLSPSCPWAWLGQAEVASLSILAVRPVGGPVTLNLQNQKEQEVKTEGACLRRCCQIRSFRFRQQSPCVLRKDWCT